MIKHVAAGRHVLALALAVAYGLGGAALAEEPVRGGAIVASIDLQPKSLDPIMGDAPTIDRYVLNQLYESLLRLDAEGNLQPSLADSWEYSADNTAITFTLRQGVKFHDGTPFDAEAVSFNLRRAISPEVNAPRRADLADIASVDVLGPTQVRVNLKQPSGAAIASLAVESGMMASPAAVEKYGPDYGRNPVGTGAFKFTEWKAGSHLALEGFDGYWRAGADGKPLPYADQLTVRFIPNTAVKMVEIRSGYIHLVDTVTPKDYATVENDSNLRLVSIPNGVSQWVALNTSKPPFDSLEVRQAFNYAINREALMKIVTRGYGAVTPTLVPPSDWAFAPDLKGYTYDPAKAKELLARAGKEGGVKATMSVIQRDPDTQVAQVIQQMVKAAGIELEIEILERQGWMSKVLSGRDHETAMGRVGIPRADPDQIFGPFFGRDAAQNWSVVKDEKLFETVEAARRSVDKEERKKLYAAAQERLLEQAYYAFLFFREQRQVARAELKNLQFDVGGAWLLAETWLAE